MPGKGQWPRLGACHPLAGTWGHLGKLNQFTVLTIIVLKPTIPQPPTSSACSGDYSARQSPVLAHAWVTGGLYCAQRAPSPARGGQSPHLLPLAQTLGPWVASQVAGCCHLPVWQMKNSDTERRGNSPKATQSGRAPRQLCGHVISVKRRLQPPLLYNGIRRPAQWVIGRPSA